MFDPRLIFIIIKFYTRIDINTHNFLRVTLTSHVTDVYFSQRGIKASRCFSTSYSRGYKISIMKVLSFKKAPDEVDPIP